MVQLIKFKNPNHLAEIFQAVDVKFAFVKKAAVPEEVFEEVTMPGKCRDFLGDVLYSRVKNVPVHIWGFQYEYSKAPYDDDALQLSLKFPNEEALNNFKNHLEYLNAKEQKAGTSLTKILDTEEKNTLIVIADKVWQSSPWRLSLYTFYIKVASYASVSELAVPESQYIQALTEEKEKILLSHVTDGIVNFQDTLNHNHDLSGFIATIKGQNVLDHKRMFGGK
jgi:hypothetical protein